MEKRLKAVVFVLGILFLISFVSATTTINSPVDNGNYSTTLNFTVTTDLSISTSLNVSLYFNASGGAGQLIQVISNSSSPQTIFANESIDLVGVYLDGPIYNFSAYADNGTDQEWASVSNVTLDSTAPSVVNFTGTVDGGSYTGMTELNVSVEDALIGLDSAYLNYTNSSGVQNLFVKMSCSGGVCNYTGNVTAFTDSYGDGVYNITVYANDSLNNLNNTEVITVNLDSTVPSSVVLASSSSSSTSLTFTATITDALSGGGGTCTIDRSGASVSSGTGTSVQTVTETGLSCGNSYSYVVTCYDKAGNANSSVSTSFSTSSCSTGGTSSSSSTTWDMTYVVNDDDFENGYSKEVKEEERLKVKVGSSYHYVGVLEVSEDKAKIEIRSDPIEIELAVGEDAKVDSDDDGVYDIYLKLNSIDGSKIDLYVKSINEVVPEGEDSVSTSGDVASQEGDEVVGDSDESIDEGGSKAWLWVLIVLLIVAGLGGGGYAFWKKKNSSGWDNFHYK